RSPVRTQFGHRVCRPGEPIVAVSMDRGLAGGLSDRSGAAGKRATPRDYPGASPYPCLSPLMPVALLPPNRDPPIAKLLPAEDLQAPVLKACSKLDCALHCSRVVHQRRAQPEQRNVPMSRPKELGSLSHTNNALDVVALEEVVGGVGPAGLNARNQRQMARIS